MKTGTQTRRMMEAAVVLTLFSGLASAGFTVQSFSCNSQLGTMSIESGGTLNCQATLKNTGGSAANMSSVSLLTDGNWAEQNSYTGLGYETSVSAGSTTTATFGNLKPTTSGVHKFNYVRIDSVTDSQPASADVNVIAIKNTVLTSPVLVTSGSDFTVSVSVTAGGNLDLGLSINATNCSLAAGELSTRSLGTVSDNTIKSASWRITQGSGTCNYGIIATGSAGASSVSSTTTSSVAVLASTTTTTTTSSTTTTTIQVIEVNETVNTTAGTPTNVSGGSTNTTLQIVTSGDVSDATVEFATHDGNPTGTNFALASIGRYVNITPSAELSGNLSWMLVNMTYTAAELTAANINESLLWIYWFNSSAESWVPLNESGKSGRDNTTDPRSVWANITHFSTFTIGGSALTEDISTDLVTGWNLISIPLNI